MILQTFKTEFAAVSREIGSVFVSKDIAELQKYVQGYAFEKPLIVFEPLSTFTTEIRINGQQYYTGNMRLFFLDKAVKSDSEEDARDIIIDNMIEVSRRFFSTLHKNNGRLLNTTNWTWTNTILRQYTSNFLSGIRSDINFETQCNRIKNYG